MSKASLKDLRDQVAADADGYLEEMRAFLARTAEQRGYSVIDLVAVTGLSVNTVKAALRPGSRPTAHTLALIGAAINFEVTSTTNTLAAKPAPAGRVS